MTDNKIEDAMVCSTCDTKRKAGYDYICGHTSNIDVGTPDNHWRDHAKHGEYRTMNQKAVFERKTYAETEFEITRSIEVYRKPNGDVELRIAAEREGNDPVSLPYILSADDAEKLGRVLLCIDDTTFDELIERSQVGGR